MAGIRSVNISLCRGRFWLFDWLGRDWLFFLCFIASDFGVNLITNSQLNSWLKFAWTDLRQFPIVCVTSFEAWFSGVIARILDILQTDQIQEYLGLWDWITRQSPPTPPHGGIDHRTFSTYIYIKIEIKLQKMIHSFKKKPSKLFGGGLFTFVALICCEFI